MPLLHRAQVNIQRINSFTSEQQNSLPALAFVSKLTTLTSLKVSSSSEKKPARSTIGLAKLPCSEMTVMNFHLWMQGNNFHVSEISFTAVSAKTPDWVSVRAGPG